MGVWWAALTTIRFDVTKGIIRGDEEDCIKSLVDWDPDPDSVTTICWRREDVSRVISLPERGSCDYSSNKL